MNCKKFHVFWYELAKVIKKWVEFNFICKKSENDLHLFIDRRQNLCYIISRRKKGLTKGPFLHKTAFGRPRSPEISGEKGLYIK